MFTSTRGGNIQNRRPIERRITFQIERRITFQLNSSFPYTNVVYQNAIIQPLVILEIMY